MEKVHQGEAVSIKAATWNSFLDAAEFARRARRLVGAETVPSGFGGNMVYVRNKCGETIPRFGAVVLADAVIPHDAASEDIECETPAFDGVPAEGGEESESEEESEKEVRPFAVAVEPIENGEIGRALALGVTPAKVDIVHEDDACAEPVPGSASGAMRSTNVGYARIIWKEDGTGEKWCFLRLGASEPQADEKSVDFAPVDPETAEDEDAAKTEKLEIKGFSSKDAEEETLGERLSAAGENASEGGGDDEEEDEVIVRSGDRKKIKFMKIGRGAASVEVDDVSIDFTKKNPESGGSDEKTNKLQIFGFDSQDAEEESLADRLSEEDAECDEEMVVRAADRKSLKYIRIGASLVTILEAGDNITLEQNGKSIVISAEGGAEPGDFVTSGYSTPEGESDEEIADIRYYDHQLQVRKARKVYERGLLKTRVLVDWETFTTAVEETV